MCVRGNGVFRRAARGSLGSVVCRSPTCYQTAPPNLLHPLNPCKSPSARPGELRDPSVQSAIFETTSFDRLWKLFARVMSGIRSLHAGGRSSGSGMNVRVDTGAES